MLQLTPIERQAIEGILNSDFQDNGRGPQSVGHQVWSWSANPFPSKRTFSGAISSLVKKGFVRAGGEGEDATLEITQAGWDVLNT